MSEQEDDRRQDDRRQSDKRKKRSDAAAQAAKKSDDGGGGGWITTFADLMSLLMAFFVLLYAFSEVDKAKFETLGDSLKSAFGVEPDPEKKEIVKQKEKVVVAVPVPSQDTSTPTPQGFTMTCTDPLSYLNNQQRMPEEPKPNVSNTEKTKKDYEFLRQVFEEEIKVNLISVGQEGEMIVIQLIGDNSFEPGSADLSDQTVEIVEKFSKAIQKIKGHVIIEGHTDNKPIMSAKFQSNWALSSARAASIVYALELREIDRKRMSIRGFADTKPVAGNDTPEGRAKNRRIEIKIHKSQLNKLKKLKTLQ